MDIDTYGNKKNEAGSKNTCEQVRYYKKDGHWTTYCSELYKGRLNKNTAEKVIEELKEITLLDVHVDRDGEIRKDTGRGSDKSHKQAEKLQKSRKLRDHRRNDQGRRKHCGNRTAQNNQRSMEGGTYTERMEETTRRAAITEQLLL